ncbi:MAG TPA: hypothetical protein PKE57_08415 [Cellvibrionaceae bacterium]|nr:hypothetical protein [Cellvibrionaceae bacterium]
MHAAEAEIDTDLMQNIEDTNKSLSSNIALENGKGSASDAKDLSEMFAVVEQHFAKKPGATDATNLSKKSKDLSLQIIVDVGAKRFEEANNLATELSRACKSCHAFYKKD